MHERRRELGEGESETAVPASTAARAQRRELPDHQSGASAVASAQDPRPVRPARRDLVLLDAVTATGANGAGLPQREARVPHKQRGRRADILWAADIVDALIPEALSMVGGDASCAIRELVIPVTAERADLAAIGRHTWLFEIKSARDTLRRLGRQAEAFARIADRCVLAAHSRHLGSATAMLPPWWGVIEVLDGLPVTLKWHRSAHPNPCTDRRTLLLMLRSDEAVAALAGWDGCWRTGRRRMSLLAEIDRCLDDERIAECVREALLRRRGAAPAGTKRRLSTAQESISGRWPAAPPAERTQTSGGATSRPLARTGGC